jgi:hypothetical protein
MAHATGTVLDKPGNAQALNYQLSTPFSYSIVDNCQWWHHDLTIG